MNKVIKDETMAVPVKFWIEENEDLDLAPALSMKQAARITKDFVKKVSGRRKGDRMRSFWLWLAKKCLRMAGWSRYDIDKQIPYW